MLAIVLCITKFQDDIINQGFLLKVECKATKDVLKKDVKNLVSKQIFARLKRFIIYVVDLFRESGARQLPI